MSAGSDTAGMEAAVLRKLDRHLLPLFCVLTVLNYIDRTNLAFAALQLNKALGFSEHVYGLGASIFFVGYTLCQVPSNLILMKVGAPLWLSIIIVSWGVTATAFAGLNGTTSFYVLRLLLGCTEAGTFPGIWYVMSNFYSDKELALSYSYVSASTAVSQVMGAPLAAALLALDGLFGVAGWQYLFLLEGIYVRFAMADSPSQAAFLSPVERSWLQQRNADLKASSQLPGCTWS
eukprot:jgi/Astpho2/9901/Aster-06613